MLNLLNHTGAPRFSFKKISVALVRERVARTSGGAIRETPQVVELPSQGELHDLEVASPQPSHTMRAGTRVRRVRQSPQGPSFRWGRGTAPPPSEESKRIKTAWALLIFASAFILVWVGTAP